ncbi:unnamed protein product [Cyprideis torosa]|uniref:Prolyl 4-hydroxylase alpha subunit domain-containing protein n=1 Tax=Cyprideis torosa TaxID=163714 RepID=A0A7R8WBJ2_9CRUS|nr:unnamed protein product [Cyprideis torosa]CAG0892375.1 unnamed protein product [Cyprideis torosa]
MKFALFFSCFVIVVAFSCVSSSTVHMKVGVLKQLPSNEESLLSTLKTYTKNEQFALDQLQKLITIQKQRKEAAEEHVLKKPRNANWKTFRNHPVNAYVTLRRMAVWSGAVAFMNHTENDEELAKGIVAATEKGFPTENDIKGALETLMKIQRVEPELVEAWVTNPSGTMNQTHEQLKASDFYEILKVGVANYQSYTSSFWKEMVVRESSKTTSGQVGSEKLPTEDVEAYFLKKISDASFKEENQEKIMQSLDRKVEPELVEAWVTNPSGTMNQTHEQFKASDFYEILKVGVADYLSYISSFWKEMVVRESSKTTSGQVGSEKLPTEDVEAYFLKKITDASFKEENQEEIMQSLDRFELRLISHELELYKMEKEESAKQMCKSSSPIITSNPTETLHCRFFTNGGNPLLILAPVKLQERSIKPLISEFVDIFTERDMDHLQELAIPRLELSRVAVDFPTDNSSVNSSYYRTGEVAWIKSNASHIAKRIVERIEAVTGMTDRTAEPLQVAAYAGPPVKFYVHLGESLLVLGKPLANRCKEYKHSILSVLHKLNTVPLGGRTVFPVINVALKPKKGSAVLFWDLQRNGGDDSLTFHEACPVVIGEKWISTKWFHELGNDKVLPCSVEAEDTGLDDLKSKLLEEIGD